MFNQFNYDYDLLTSRKFLTFGKLKRQLFLVIKLPEIKLVEHQKILF